MQKANLAQDESIVNKIPKQGPTELSITTGSTTDAAAEFKAEFQPWTGAAWVELPIRQSGGIVTGLTGPNQVGFVNVPAGENVRVRRNDSNGGDGTVGSEIINNSPGRVF